MPDIPLLALWRTVPAPYLRNHPELARDLRALLVEQTRPESEDERRLLAQILRPESEAPILALAARLCGRAPDQSDLAMSWVLVAALDRSDLAIAILVQELLLHAWALDRPDRRKSEYSELPKTWPRVSGRFAARRAQAVALSWAPSVTASLLRAPSYWLYELQRTKTALSAEPERAQANEEAAPQPTVDGGLSLTVVASIGDSASDDGEALGRLYAGLTKPLPLVGGDADPDTVAAALALEFPHLDGAIAAVVQDLRLRRRGGAGPVYVRPLLLIGPSGIGKTRFARTLAQRIGVGCGEVAVAGSSDDRMLRGTARGWRHMQPALPLLVMLQAGCANPLIVMDELDKAGGNERSGDMRQTLVPLLEPHTARRWFDECLLAPCDLPRVSWICTANEMG